MIRLNFQEACLLDASGELTPAARQEFLDYLQKNPSLAGEYHHIRAQFDSFEPDPVFISKLERDRIVSEIKAMVARALAQQKLQKQAAARKRLIQYALAGLSASAAVVALVVGLGLPAAASRTREQKQIAAINSTVDHLSAVATASDTRFSDVDASIRQLETESPTLAQLHAANMSNLMNALVAVPPGYDDFAVSYPR